MPALGMEENQPRPGQLLDAEQVQFLAQLAMVALLGLFQLVQMYSSRSFFEKNAVP